jgi:hypothetical protein
LLKNLIKNAPIPDADIKWDETSEECFTWYRIFQVLMTIKIIKHEPVYEPYINWSCWIKTV